MKQFCRWYCRVGVAPLPFKCHLKNQCNIYRFQIGISMRNHTESIAVEWRTGIQQMKWKYSGAILKMYTSVYWSDGFVFIAISACFYLRIDLCILLLAICSISIFNIPYTIAYGIYEISICLWAYHCWGFIAFVACQPMPLFMLVFLLQCHWSAVAAKPKKKWHSTMQFSILDSLHWRNNNKRNYYWRPEREWDREPGREERITNRRERFSGKQREK